MVRPSDIPNLPGFDPRDKMIAFCSAEVMITEHIFKSLPGTWTGEGRGEFPGVTSFAYRETLVFTRHDENRLIYEQTTQKLYDGQTEYLPSHAEHGVLRSLEN